MRTAFISGHLSITQDEFEAHYIPQLLIAIEQGHNFVIGDAPGGDTLAQAYLAQHISKERVTVYHAYESPRNNFGFRTLGRYSSQSAKDHAMTKASDYDIAWVRPGRENSGTARNIIRRKVAKEDDHD